MAVALLHQGEPPARVINALTNERIYIWHSRWLLLLRPGEQVPSLTATSLKLLLIINGEEGWVCSSGSWLRSWKEGFPYSAPSVSPQTQFSHPSEQTPP